MQVRDPLRPRQLQGLGDEHAPGGCSQELRPPRRAPQGIRGRDGQTLQGREVHL